jgi:hypothetical protein
MRFIIDDSERTIIALFDHNVFPTQQTGRYYSAHIPLASDHSLFAKLGCNFFQMFAIRVDAQSPAGAEIRHKVTKWAQKVRQHAMDHPVEAFTSIFPITDNYFDILLLEQAFPV